MHFLDTKPADFGDDGLSRLHEVLIRAYDDEVEALALAGQVGLLRADIARHPKLRFTWMSIIEEAAKEHQLRRLVDLALKDPAIAGWHVRIRDAIQIPEGPIAPAAPARRSSDAAPTPKSGQQPHVGDRAPLWKPGARLAVRFLDGSSTLRERVAEMAQQWLEYANLELEFGDEEDAPIRVSFEQPGAWAYQGLDALAVAADQPTVNFGWLDENTEEREVVRVVLHEFGHVLGLQHEHGNPASTIAWNRPAVYAMYGGPPNHWSRETIDHVVFSIWPPSYFPVHKIFDRSSIMMFPQPAEHLLEGEPVGPNYELSPVDKQFVAALYPLRDGR
jgi:serralysin